MIFSTIWTIILASGWMYLMRAQGRTPVVIAMVMALLVFAGGAFNFLNNPTRAHYADFTAGAALDALFLAALIWRAFAKTGRNRHTTEKTQ